MTTQRHPALIAPGKQIRKVRRERGFSQEGFAAEVDLDRSYYGSVECGERKIAALNLMRIAIALEVEVGELFPRAEEFRDILNRDTDKEADHSV